MFPSASAIPGRVFASTIWSRAARFQPPGGDQGRRDRLRPGGTGDILALRGRGSRRARQRGTHVAFQARSREQLHEAAEAAAGAGSTFTRQPGPHPDIALDYYGAVFLDPDGHKLEIVVEAD